MVGNYPELERRVKKKRGPEARTRKAPGPSGLKYVTDLFC